MTPPAGRYDLKHPEKFTGPFSGAIGDIEVAVDKIVDSYNLIVRHINEKAPRLGFAMYWVSLGMNEARNCLQKILPVAQYLIKHSTPVISLYDSASQWVTQVEGPTSTLSYKINTSEPNLAHWSDAAYTSYDRVRGKQGQAAIATAARARFVANWLSSLAQSNFDMATGVLSIVTSLVGSLSQAVVDTGGLISIPEAVDALAKSVGECVSKGLDQLLKLAEKFADDLGKKIDLLGQMNDNGDLPDGKWPQLAPN